MKEFDGNHPKYQGHVCCDGGCKTNKSIDGGYTCVKCKIDYSWECGGKANIITFFEKKCATEPAEGEEISDLHRWIKACAKDWFDIEVAHTLEPGFTD